MAVLIGLILNLIGNSLSPVLATEQIANPSAYFDDESIYFQFPSTPDGWIVNENNAQECSLVEGLKSLEGVHLLTSDRTRKTTFLADWGVLYRQTEQREGWQAFKTIETLNSALPDARWHRLLIQSSATQPVLHSLLWISRTHLIINDLRFGTNVYSPAPKFGTRWYVIDLLDSSCRVGAEIARSYGTPNLQQVTLQLADGSNVHIASGRMSLDGNVIVGNWYRP